MSSTTRRSSFDRILIDLNTQCDLLLPRGALPVTNRAAILPNIRRLMNWGRVERVPIISSLESHRPGESSRGLPSYCVDRTSGQRKIPFTLMPRRVVFAGDNTIDLPIDVFRRFQQVIFTKRCRDFLSNPKADRLMQAVAVNHLVIFGTVAEHCVKAAALGLLARQHRVAVVTDACGFWSATDADLAMRQIEAKGAILVTTEELISGAADERIRNSRPSPPVVEEVEVPIDGNGSRSHNGNGRKRILPGFGVVTAGADGPPARRDASRKLRPDVRSRKGGAGVPPTHPSSGLA